MSKGQAGRALWRARLGHGLPPPPAGAPYGACSETLLGGSGFVLGSRLYKYIFGCSESVPSEAHTGRLHTSSRSTVNGRESPGAATPPPPCTCLSACQRTAGLLPVSRNLKDSDKPGQFMMPSQIQSVKGSKCHLANLARPPVVLGSASRPH